MRAIFGAIIARSVAQTGSPEGGYEWLRKLDANTREYTVNPTIMYTKLGRQEGVITLYNMPDMAALQQRLGMPVKYSIPTSGTPLLVDAIAVVRGTENAEIAKRYYEFVTTPEALIFAADSFMRIPARRDVPNEELPAWIQEANAQIVPMPLDRALIAENLDEWMTYWDSHIRNSGRRQ
jgi:iron(III) transport system substrate-binding protein